MRYSETATAPHAALHVSVARHWEKGEPVYGDEGTWFPLLIETYSLESLDEASVVYTANDIQFILRNVLDDEDAYQTVSRVKSSRPSDHPDRVSVKTLMEEDYIRVWYADDRKLRIQYRVEWVEPTPS